MAGGAAIAAFVSAAPAAAQYYPGYGYPGYGYGNGGVVGQVINQVLGGGYGGYGGYGNSGYGYGANSQMAVNQCTGAVQARISRGGYGGGYGQYGGYGGGRVLGISRVEPRSSGGLTVRGVATSGMSGGYGYGGQGQADLTFKCKVDYRGYVSSVDLNRINTYGSNYNQYNQYNPYGAYGYRRY